MRWWFALCAFGLMAGPAAADPLSDYQELIAQAHEEWEARRNATMATCSEETAREVPFNELALHSPYYSEQCVKVSGLFYSWRLFGSPEHLYLSQRWEAEPTSRLIGGPNPFRLGLDFYDVERPEVVDAFRPAVVIGRLTDCLIRGDMLGRKEALQTLIDNNQGAISISTLSGYCHGFYGGTIDVEHISLGAPQRFPRLMGQESLARYGSLRPLDSASWERSRLADLAETLFELIRAGDEPALLALAGGSTEVTDDLFEGYDHAVFRDLAAFREMPPFVILEASNGLGPNQLLGEEEEDRDPPGRHICYCRSRDCEGRWPISVLDAHVSDERPYVCLERSIGHIVGGGQHPVVLPLVGHEGLPGSPFHEPDSAAPN